MKYSRVASIAAASMAPIAMSTMAMAQAAVSPGSTTPEAHGGNEITEVVVTANRRSERAQTVPIAVTAISAASAQARGVTDVTSLANAVPGLRIDRAPATSTPFLRGVGSGAGSIGTEPSVSLYVDDVYTPEAGAFFANFNNIDRVEVLKGPQGTLFGRNATGGVIQVFTRNPTSEPKLDFSAGYASYDTFNGSIYASDKLAQGLSASVALYGGNQGQGWGKNLTTGKDSFKINWNEGGRVKLLYEPSDTTSVLLSVSHDTTASSEGFYHPGPGTVAYGIPTLTGPTGFYDMVDDTNPNFRDTQTGGSAKITHDLNWATVVSISAYTDFQQYLTENQAGSQFPAIHVGVQGGNKTFTQELRLQSPESSKISWIAGVFFMADRAFYDPLTISGVVIPGGSAQINSTQRTNSYSGFGQVTAPILEDTRLTAGLRYTYDDESLKASATLPGPFTLPAANSPQSKAFDKLTWRLALDHNFTPDVMAYVSYNRGFRSGGFNTVVFPGAPIAPAVNPETLDAFAIGEKAEFLDRRVQFNTEAFYYIYQNIQVQSLVAGGTVQSNAASASIKGVDVDLRVTPVRHFTLTASMEYLDAKYDSYKNGSIYEYSPGCLPGQSNCQVTADLSGFNLPYAAPFAASVSANYLLPSSVGDFNLNLAYNHGGDYYFAADNGRGQLNPSLDRQPVLNLLNATVKWTSPNQKIDVSVWGRNITDQRYYSLGGEQTVVTQLGPAAPATYGVTVDFHVF